MIRNTFSILGGVGEKTERKFWEEGFLTWDDFLSSSTPGFLSDARKRQYDEFLENAVRHLDDEDAGYFSQALKRSEHWRLYDVFGGEAVCLDIETNGWHVEAGGYPTVVGLYDGHDYQSFVWGENLSGANIMEALEGYKYLISFFGTVFDVPFLERSLSDFSIRIPHFDLCFGAKKVGLSGGLKRIETEIGIVREEDTVGIDGYEAVLLWQRARRGDASALDLLVKYNREDTVNLMELAAVVYPQLRTSTGIEEYL